MAIVTETREFRGLVSLYLDGVFALKLRQKHFALRPLAKGDEVDPEEYVGFMASRQMNEAYEYALTLLDKSDKTAAEIVRRLTERGFVRPCAEAVAERLAGNGLLDDKRYARRLAENNAGRPVGVYAVQRKLRARGISEADAEDAMALFDEDQQRDAARQAAQSLARKYRDLPRREARAKLSQALARRGFAWDAVRDAVDAALEDDDFDGAFE